MRSRWLWIALSLAPIALVWGGWSWLGERRDRNELMEADREMADGLHQLAHSALSRSPTNDLTGTKPTIVWDCARKSSATSTPPRLSYLESPQKAHLPLRLLWFAAASR